MHMSQVHIFEVYVFLGEFILGGCFPGTYISGAYVTCVSASYEHICITGGQLNTRVNKHLGASRMHCT